jgi:drug/metabolite transporter (DMT)-like permease
VPTSRAWLPGFIALGTVWGSSFLFIEWALQAFSPLGVAFLRGALGSLSLLGFAPVLRVGLPRKLIEWWHISVVAILLNAAPGFLFAFGQQYVTSVMAGILNATTPLMTLLVMTLVFRAEKVNANQIVGLVAGFGGVALVSGVLHGLGENKLIGVAALLGATFCYGLSFPYARRFVTPLPYSNTALATAQVTASAVILLPFALIGGITAGPVSATPLVGIVLLGVLGTGFAYIWNYRNMKLAGSAIASSVTYITPVVAAVLGVAFLGEHLTWDQVAGGLLVLAGAAMIQNRVIVVRSRDYHNDRGSAPSAK